MKPVPTSIKQLVQQELLAFSGKASEALRGGRFSLDDLIHSFLNGAVVKKERDETRRARYKYTITGSALDGCMVYSCGKIIDYEDGKRYFNRIGISFLNPMNARQESKDKGRERLSPIPCPL